jgi:hypothetical protein
MLTTIDLDDQLPIAANKIHDERPDGFLAHELESINGASSQLIPKKKLSVR